MKKILLPLLILAALAPQAQAAYVPVRAAGASEEGKSAAVEAAREDAVAKALSRMITPDPRSEGVFREIMSEYRAFAGEKPLVKKTQKFKGKAVAFCEVPVDIDRLKERLREKIQGLQHMEAHRDDETYFFIRVAGEADPPVLERAEMETFRAYADAFQQYGFWRGMDDMSVFDLLRDTRGFSSEAYMKRATDGAAGNMAVSLAVIGELRVEPPETDEGGTNCTVTAHLIIIKNLGEGRYETVGTLDDTYTLRRTDRFEAEKLCLQKAAYNSAKYLAHLTLEYWEKAGSP